ncbi:MAG: PLDc N-terminal domain-containing protein [Nanoarchaeota archaeon]
MAYNFLGCGIGNSMWGPFVGMMGIGLGGVLIFILFAIFWIWMLVDAVTRKFKSDIEKVVWVLVIIFTHIIGAVIYYLVVKLRSKNSRKRRR